MVCILIVKPKRNMKLSPSNYRFPIFGWKISYHDIFRKHSYKTNQLRNAIPYFDPLQSWGDCRTHCSIIPTRSWPVIWGWSWRTVIASLKIAISLKQLVNYWRTGLDYEYTRTYKYTFRLLLNISRIKEAKYSARFLGEYLVKLWSDKEQLEIFNKLVILLRGLPAERDAAIRRLYYHHLESTWRKGLGVFSPTNFQLMENAVAKLAIGNHTPVLETESVSLSQLISELISADALSRNFQRSFSWGEFAEDFMPVLFGEHLFRGFSGYSAEACHEFLHGNGSCRYLDSRDGLCNGGNHVHT